MVESAQLIMVPFAILVPARIAPIRLSQPASRFQLETKVHYPSLMNAGEGCKMSEHELRMAGPVSSAVSSSSGCRLSHLQRLGQNFALQFRASGSSQMTSREGIPAT